MFVKWTTKPRTNWPQAYEALPKSKRDAGVYGLRHPDLWSLRAELVRSLRRNGKPRQEFVGHLGTLEVWGTKHGVGHYIIRGKKRGMAFCTDLRAFWVSVILRLDELGDRVDRKAVMAKVQKVVPMWE